MALLQRPIVKKLQPLALALMATLIPATAASAQIGEASGLAEALFPEYFKRDVVIFVEGLDLDETQRVIIEALIDDYLDGFEESKLQMSEGMEAMQENLVGMDQASVLKAALQPLKDLITSKQNLSDDFLGGVQVILTDEQLSQWNSFLRLLVREKTMSRGRLSGESHDLFHVLRDMRMPEFVRNKLQPILLEYEIALDAALKARNASFRRSQMDLLDAISANSDQDTTQAERQVQLRVAIRDTSDRYRTLLFEALPELARDEFRMMSLERAYPTIYRQTMLQKLLNTARELKELDEPTRLQVEGLQVQYLTNLHDLNSELLSKLQYSEPQDMLDRIETFKARMEKRPRSTTNRNTSRANLYQREELAKPYLDSLRALLTIGQFDSLPNARRIIDRQQRIDRLRALKGFEGREASPRIKDGPRALTPVKDKNQDKNRGDDWNFQ